MGNEHIIIEKAKDNNWTCKVNINGKWRYLYSKYNPKKEINDIDTDSNYIILGIGLGYEIEQILETTNGKIYVIDKDKTFFNIMLEINDNHIIFNSRVKFFFGDEYKALNLEEINNYRIYRNENITQIHSEYYYNILKYINTKNISNNKKKVVVYEHITIADDCIEALKNIGYEVIKMYFSTQNKMLESIIKESPDYIFTINISEKVTEISNNLCIPYIAWIVDVPAYSLYSDLLKSPNVIAFSCDSNITKELSEKNFNNIFYMPVAANVKRLDKIHVSTDELLRYTCDVSFLGTTGIENEFNKYIYQLLSDKTVNEINKIFNKQHLNPNQFVIKNLIDDKLIDSIEKETGYRLISEAYLNKNIKLAFILGRKYNELQRIKMITDLSKIFNFYVYGDENWSKLCSDYIQYKGYAEHFFEMPKVFKCSKININYTRIYVESGLPMRVFDIMGSKGFLLTNYKEDIPKYFIDGKDLVIYRDSKDLIEIINYYLENEDERQEIINNGYNKIKEHHSYEKRLLEIMDISNEYLKNRYKKT